MRASIWRFGALWSCIALLALVISTGGATASDPATHFAATPFSVFGANTPLRADPATRPAPSGQPRYLGPAPSPWTKINNVPAGFVPGSMLLGLDGAVYVHQNNTGIWFKLSPDRFGSYVSGTWTPMAQMPSGYRPLYFASQILSDGRMLIEGGEYNGSITPVWTTRGAIYNPLTNTWRSVSPPTGWSQIGDAQSVLLPNGQFMMGNIQNAQDALLNSSSLAWTVQSGTGKVDRNDEEGYQLLPNAQVLTVNDSQALSDPNNPGSQVFSPSTGTWTNAGTLPVLLPHAPDQELGPMIYRPNGQVFAEGASSHTAVYHGGTTWTAGPEFPVIGGQQYDAADAPAATLPNGDVLMDLSPGIFRNPSHFFVYNGSTITQVADTANAPSDPSFVGRMLVLPTGQVMFDDGAGDLEVFNPGGAPNNSWRPTISSLSSSTLTRGGTFTLSGTQLAGRSTGASYGDDFQDNTNYPLVRITNTATGVVTYARTSSMTTHSIAPGTASSTKFTIKSTTPTGPSTLVVTANGISSAQKSVTIN